LAAFLVGALIVLGEGSSMGLNFDGKDLPIAENLPFDASKNSFPEMASSYSLIMSVDRHVEKA